MTGWIIGLPLLFQVDIENTVRGSDAPGTRVKQEVEKFRQKIGTSKEGARAAGLEHKLEEMKRAIDAQQVNKYHTKHSKLSLLIL